MNLQPEKHMGKSEGKSENIHFIVRKPIWYEDSEELTLAFTLFSEVVTAIVPEAQITVLTCHQPLNSKPDLSKLDGEVVQALESIRGKSNKSNNSQEVIFFVNEPAILLTEEVIYRMAEILGRETERCVVPQSYNFDQPDLETHYFTLQGFRRYVSEEKESTQHETEPFDGRESQFFAVTLGFLVSNGIEKDFFQIPLNFPEQSVIASGAYFHPFSDYFHGANLEIIEHIPNTAASLLDIGCSCGEFGYAVKTRRNLHVEGIEFNAAAAELAKQKLDKVHSGDALSIKPESRFDCVTCLDVLEHFPSPDALLKHIADFFLEPSGILILNLPNIGHWSIVDDLLSGHWDYLPGGTLCNTHLRFFTQHTIRDMLNRNGFSIQQIISTQFSLPEAIFSQYKLLEQAGKLIDWNNLETVSFKVIAQWNGVSDKLS